ncbi:hypothetical protein ABZ626_26385 [Streptomyces longispororuber]|uniref:hypothetical protein n=1 Tax=Streptomyces longispororuber TaxID=68230 RepID=UPI0033DDB93C
MPFPSTTLALGTSAGSLLVAALVGAAMTVVTVYGIQHHKEVFAWMRTTRARDDEAKDLEEAGQYLKDLFEELCGLAQRPCRAADVTGVARLSNVIKGSIGQAEAVSAELRAVVEHADAYLATLLPDQEPGARTTPAEHHALLVRAMKQECARIELAHALGAAQQRIRGLRRA